MSTRETNSLITKIHGLKLLGLTKTEAEVFAILQIKQLPMTPLQISYETTIPRSSIYNVLESLTNRELVKEKIIDKKSNWVTSHEDVLATNSNNIKNILLGYDVGRREIESKIGGSHDSSVVVYKGKDDFKSIAFKMLKDHNDEKFVSYSGSGNIIDGWDKIFSRDEINELNELVKSKKLISVGLLSDRWAEETYKKYGDEWARNFEGRTADTTYIDKKYFDHGGQIFSFRDVMYLLSVHDETVIEIRHSEIQKMILSLCSFLKDNGRRVDVNSILRKLINEK